MRKSSKKHLINDKYLLYTIKNASPKLRKSILQNCSPSLIKTLSEICHNVVKGNCVLSKKLLTSLKKHKKTLRSISCRSVSLASKRKHLVQKGNGFLGLILAPLLADLFLNRI